MITRRGDGATTAHRVVASVLLLVAAEARAALPDGVAQDVDGAGRDDELYVERPVPAPTEKTNRCELAAADPTTRRDQVASLRHGRWRCGEHGTIQRRRAPGALSGGRRARIRGVARSSPVRAGPARYADHPLARGRGRRGAGGDGARARLVGRRAWRSPCARGCSRLSSTRRLTFCAAAGPSPTRRSRWPRRAPTR